MSEPTSGNVSAPPRKVGIVLPGDNRVPVNDTKLQPFRWVGRITATWPNASSWGTATLLDDRHLITCAHNFFDYDKKVECRSAAFTPACNRVNATAVTPYGTFQIAKWAVPEDYRRSGCPVPPEDGVAPDEVTEYLSDFAVARLSQPVNDPPAESHFYPFWPGDAQVRGGLQCNLTGYPRDKDPQGMKQINRGGPVSLMEDQDAFVTYKMSTLNGDSGAPVYYQVQQGDQYLWRIVAIHVTGRRSGQGLAGVNFGPALNEVVMGQLHQMIEEVDH